MSGRKGIGHYSAATKVEAVRLFLEEQMAYHAIAERLAIRRAERIEAWVRAYRREGELGLHKSKGPPRKKQDQAVYIAGLEMENALLNNSPQVFLFLSTLADAVQYPYPLLFLGVNLYNTDII
jgi:transposase-like protein